jgi:UDP-N-acetylglucosamine--N-acetylmuramyl-(pentapeptide) pyrophosphoryl-undecaprenol N-acetylglucosamine transferase
LRLLICAGGTGGGVYPALAVVQALTNDSGWQPADGSQRSSFIDGLLWIGGEGGMEVNLVKQVGVPFEAIPAAGVHGVGWRALPGNAWQLGLGYLAARRLLRAFRPEVLFFTGGYLAVPVALAARMPGRGYPRPRSLVYIPDIEPGLALKSLARLADRIAVTTQASRAFLRGHPSVVVTGYPTRADLRIWDKERAWQALSLSPDMPVLLVFGGSRGARSINKAVWSDLPELLGEMQVVHLTGKLDWPDVEHVQQRLAASLPQEHYTRYHPYPYLQQEMGAAFTVADLALCRSGASTLGELPLFGLPAALVPYPYAWRYQQVNAQFLAERGAAVILQDSELPYRLLVVVRELMGDASKRALMRQAMAALAQPAAAEKIAGQLVGLASRMGGKP